MPTPAETLAAIVDGGRGAEESDALLGAIVDGGVNVPVDDRGAVMFVDLSGPVLPGYVDGAARERWLPEAADAVWCDVLRLLDIAEHTGVGSLAVFGAELWVKVPIGLIVRTLRDRGIHTQDEQTVDLRRSTHPVAVALRDAVADRILSYPAVRAVWIAHARFIETGHEQIMVHIALDRDDADDAKAMLAAIINTEVMIGPDDPYVAVRMLLPHDGEAIEAIDELGLDTVRSDGSRVTVVSREYDR